jgi:hypothetical protein
MKMLLAELARMAVDSEERTAKAKVLQENVEAVTLGTSSYLFAKQRRTASRFNVQVFITMKEKCMDPNVKTEHKRVVVNDPGQRREVVTERTERGTEPAGISTGAIALITLLAVMAIGVIVYLVTNSNANESANRNSNVDVASQSNPQQPPVIVQQPAQQAPVIIQQPAAAQQAPIIIQQPAQPSQRENTSANVDANMQDIATKRLAENVDMLGIVITVSDARAVLTGTVNSEATKAKAEQLVKAVRGVKSVDNKLVASS